MLWSLRNTKQLTRNTQNKKTNNKKQSAIEKKEKNQDNVYKQGNNIRATHQLDQYVIKYQNKQAENNQNINIDNLVSNNLKYAKTFNNTAQFGSIEKYKVNTSRQKNKPRQQFSLQPNSKPPKPILQTKLTKTHSNLTQIPLPPEPHTLSQVHQPKKPINNPSSRLSTTSRESTTNSSAQLGKDINLNYRPELIQQLYLSHNRISSVRGTLRLFVVLRNLNLSYNLLWDVGEFVGELLGNYGNQGEYANRQGYISQQNNMDILNHINTDSGYQNLSSFQTFGQGRNPISAPNSNQSYTNPIIPLKMLYIRMNKFPYGYQDEIIKRVTSLERFEDYLFGDGRSGCEEELNFDLSYGRSSSKGRGKSRGKGTSSANYIDRQLCQNLSTKISQYFLPSYSQLHKATNILLTFPNQIHNSEQYNISKIRSSLSRYQPVISKLCKYLKPTTVGVMKTARESVYVGESQVAILGRLIDVEMVCMGLRDCGDLGFSDDKAVFRHIVRQILLMFSKRNNHHLLKTLQQTNSTTISTEPPNGLQLQQLITAFGLLYNARRYTIYQQNPGKYLDKISSDKVRQHPLMKYVNYGKDERVGYGTHDDSLEEQQGTTTLVANRRQCKNTIYRQFQQFKPPQQDRNQQQDKPPYFQLIPIIVYQRNYLQIIEHIWDHQIKLFIKAYDTADQLINMVMEQRRKQSLVRDRGQNMGVGQEQQKRSRANFVDVRLLNCEDQLGNKQYLYQENNNDMPRHNESLHKKAGGGTNLNNKLSQSRQKQQDCTYQINGKVSILTQPNYNHRLYRNNKSKSNQKSRQKSFNSHKSFQRSVDQIQNDKHKQTEANVHKCQDNLKIVNQRDAMAPKKVRIDSKISTLNNSIQKKSPKLQSDKKQDNKKEQQQANKTKFKFRRNWNGLSMKQNQQSINGKTINRKRSQFDQDIQRNNPTVSDFYRQHQIGKEKHVRFFDQNVDQLSNIQRQKRKVSLDKLINQTKDKPRQQPKLQSRKHNCKKRSKENNEINKYSIYQIKLAYKVLLALKANKVKKINKRAKKCKQNSKQKQ